MIDRARHEAASICKGDFMTRFFLNEREIEGPPYTSSLEELLKHIEKAHLTPDTVVREIQVDGLPLTPDAISKGAGEILGPTANRGKIEVFTGTLSEIARDSVIEAVDYVRRAEKLIPSLSASFQVSPGPEAFEDLRRLFEGFYWLSLLLDKLEQNYHVDLKDVIVGEKSAREHLDKFAAIMRQLVDSQEKGDFVFISDLLEYEIMPLVPVWVEIFAYFSNNSAAAE